MPNDLAVVYRENGNGPALEADWNVIRREPTGAIVVEKDGTRKNILPVEFEKVNFPGSDAVVRTLSFLHADPATITVFAAGDYATVRAYLVRRVRDTDPAFSGSDTATDLMGRLTLRISTVERSAEMLGRDLERANHEYNGFVVRLASENDRKDSLLARVRGLEDQLSTRKHELSVLVPEWQDALAALKALEGK
jgi:hypothetical protein